MSEERVFLAETNVYVTSARIVIEGTTYSTAHVTSVRKKITPANTGCATLVAVLGGIVALSGIGNLFGRTPEGGLAILFIGLVVLVAGIAAVRSQEPTCRVHFTSASGEHYALTSPDESLIDRATIAIVDAIVFRG